MHININIIATRRYHIFVQPLIDSICKYFLLRHKITINLFSDDLEKQYDGDDRVSVDTWLIDSYGWPEATLLRYRIMSGIHYDCDYIFYLDADYIISSEVDEEILGPIVAVLHPGFSIVGGGSWCTDERSMAFTKPENRENYFCGGTSGGSKDHYVAIMNLLADRIDDDTSRGIKAEHNDEQHWNWYLSQTGGVKILDCSYCMVEQEHLRKLWKIDHLTPKILALSKNHSEFQQP